MALKKQLFGLAAVGSLLAASMVYTAAPVNSVATVNLTGSANSAIALYAGAPNGTPLTNAPGIVDGTFTPVAVDTADGFTETVNYGTLTNGDGTNSTARVTLRQRGNTPCHVSCSVQAYSANNISYNGTALTNGAAPCSELTFIRLGSLAPTTGANGSTAGFGYGTRFTSGIDTLATLNGGVKAAVATGSDQFVQFTSKPSTAGSLAPGQDNYVEDTATFAVPTGFIWAPNGAAPNNWSVTVQFGIFSGP